ncbi:hypothetical protein Trydic_g23676 [Trypoxylus dichotomus]
MDSDGPADTRNNSKLPKFREPISNVTVAVGREAILACEVEDLGEYKKAKQSLPEHFYFSHPIESNTVGYINNWVAWLQVNSQTVLTIHIHVITKNRRIGVTHGEHQTWYLHIKNVRKSDEGWYMCQINTDPMMSQMGYLTVVVAPDILDYATSTDMIVREGSNVNLKCVARGSPEPSITWKREGGDLIRLPTGEEVASVNGSTLNISRVNRRQMGPYLCIASNGVPPSVSKRIMLIIHFPPMIWIQNQMVGAYEGQQVVLECHSEAFPKPINYWTTDTGEIVPESDKYELVTLESNYKIIMKLLIKSLTQTDFGAYKCVSKNSLGDTDASIQLYAIPRPSKRSNGTSKKDSDDQPDSLFQEKDFFNSSGPSDRFPAQISSMDPVHYPAILISHEVVTAKLFITIPYTGYPTISRIKEKENERLT